MMARSATSSRHSTCTLAQVSAAFNFASGACALTRAPLLGVAGTSSLAATSAKSGPRDGVLPSPWQTLCAALLPEELPIQDRCSLREIELVDAVRASLCAGRLQLQVETGLVEQRYEMKPKPLSSGTQFKASRPDSAR